MITNVNLPAAQLQVAMGIPLYCIPDIRRLYGVNEDDVTPIDFDVEPPVQPRGHVIACRITAENPDAGFQPTSGAIRELNFRSIANVWGYFSVDGSGRVHEYADSQFGHLFSWGTTRDIARKNMVQALREFSIRGEIRTTIEYLLQLIQNESYVKNQIDTNWLDTLIRSNLQTNKPDACFVVLVAAACQSFTQFKQRKNEYIAFIRRGQIPPSDLLSTCCHEDLIYDNMKYAIDVHLSGDSLLTLSTNNSSVQIQIRELANGGFLLNTNGQSHVAYLMETGSGLRLNVDGITCIFSEEYDPTILRCPNSGKLARFLVRCGDHVDKGQAFAEMEVMKMYLPLAAQESCTITSIVKSPGSVVQSGDILGYVKLDDPSKVRRAEVFTSKLPVLEVTSSVQVKRPHHLIKSVLNLMEAFINGYWVPLNQIDSCLDSFLEAVHDSSLPFYEYLDILSTMEACLPDALKEELNTVLFQENRSDSSPRSTSQEEVSLSFREVFPAKQIRQVLNKHVMLAKNRGELQQIVAPLYEVVGKYGNGLEGYSISTLFHLLDVYIANERSYESLGKPGDTMDLSRRNTDANYCEQVWRCMFSHNQLKQKGDLIIRVMNLLSSFVPSMHEESNRLNKVLQEISSYSDHSTTSVSLEARQLLLQRKLPSHQEELEVVRNALISLEMCRSEAERENELKKLVDQSNDVRQALMEVLRETDQPSLASAALECYLRKIYRPYILVNIEPCLQDVGTAFGFDFTSESPELPTGLRPSASFSSIDNSPISSPRSPVAETSTLSFAHGIIMHAKDVSHIRSLLPRALQLFGSHLDGERCMNAIHVVLSTTSDCMERDDKIRTFEEILSQYKSELNRAGVSRVTITQSPCSTRIENRWDLPTSFTFRSRLGFKEDPLVRHIEPPLAYHLELHRLRNFNIRLVPIPNRNIHLYEATPKEAAIVRGAKLPIRKRFFVRAVCTTLDPLETETLTDTYPSAEKTLVEALNALDVGLGEARLRGDDNQFAGNHIFLNILPPAEVDPNLIEQIMKNLYLRYVRRLTALHVTQVEMRLLPILTHGAQPIPVRMVGADPTGMALRIDTYVETKDNFTGAVIFTSINQSISDVVGEWDGHSVSLPYPVLEFLERERAYAQKSSNTLYCYDFLELIQRVMLQRWKSFLRNSEASSIVMPNTIMKVCELELTGTPGNYGLKEVIRGPGKNKIGMVAWQLTLFTPTYPKEGRDIIVIANDITFKAGSFGTREDAFFNLVSQRARSLGIPRVFFAANSGARIGLAEEVKRAFQIKWVRDGDPESGVDFLYLTAQDYLSLSKSVVVHPVMLNGNMVYAIDAIIGSEPDLGVENLAGSGLIAGETSRAYKDIVTLTVVTGRSVGIGAYLVRLGQRTIQKAAEAPIILTGYEALNQLMGKPVYASNDQLGGPGIMCPNGVTHIRVSNDIEGVNAMLRWLSYIPRTNKAELLPQPLSAAVDVIDRPVAFMPTKVAYDVRHLIAGTTDESGQWVSGLFDKDSFMEVLADWAKTVVVGRARLGGIPVGVVATENRTVEAVIPADPAAPQTEESVVQQAGGVWYPDSAYKTAQAIEDINQEGLPLFIIANWRGFSGGARDMFQEILKFGSYIVDQLVEFHQPVFVYIPPMAEMRGGAFVVVDSHINPEVMEMYADPESRAGVLEPAGVVTIKFRSNDKKEAMIRTDRSLQQIQMALSDLSLSKEARAELLSQQEARERELQTPYQQVAETFADLHDRADRMQAVGVIRKVVPLERARKFFYWRLRRRLIELKICKEISQVTGKSLDESAAVLEEWFSQSNQHRFSQESQWEDDEVAYHWMEHEQADSIFLRINNLKRIMVKDDIVRLGKENPYTVAEGVLDLLSSLSGEVKERVVSTLKRGVLLRNQSQAEFYEEDRQFIEF